MFDIRCLSLTISRNTCVPQVVKLHHCGDCRCQSDIIIEHRQAVTITGPAFASENCPCGVPRHSGLCADAIRAAQGLEPIKWRP